MPRPHRQMMAYAGLLVLALIVLGAVVKFARWLGGW
jgi:hypothetical protein